MSIHDKYALTEELSKGQSKQFGRTFSGVSKVTGDKVLLKFVAKKGQTIGIERIRNERHFDFVEEGLPKILDYFESENECILVRKFQEGIPLDQYWKTIRKNERSATMIKVLEKLAPLLQVLKSKGIIHCDLKPSNILIAITDNDFNVALIDFGLAVQSAMPEQRKLIFPLGFAAPELLLNELAIVDQRTDLFSLGITCWFLFTGELPLTHPNPSVYTNLQLTHPLPDHSSLPRNWYFVLKKMTHKHIFRTAPNLIANHERLASLCEGIEGRYGNMEEILLDLMKFPVKKNWFRF